MPKKEAMEANAKYNVLYIRSTCEPSLLEGYCVPEKSYAEFVCKSGFKHDPTSGIYV
jgi:hypothetical protein